MNCPIVFLRDDSRTGTPFYGTAYAIAAAKAFNPNGRVVLISDEINRRDDCEWFHVEQFSYSKSRFLEAYQPDLSLPMHAHHWFNMATLTPWLVLADWCFTTPNVPWVCHLDTDVLCFCDVAKESEHWNNHEFTASSPEGSPQAPIFIHRLTLRFFVNWLLEKPWLKHPHEPLHAMNAWRLFAHEYQITPADTSVPVDESVWDHSLTAAQGLVTRGEGKELTWLHGQPFGKSILTQQPVRLCNLHCWGPYKERMADLWQASRDSL